MSICRVFISIHTRLRLTPKNKERNIFIETAPVTVLPANFAADYRKRADAIKLLIFKNVT